MRDRLEETIINLNAKFLAAVFSVFSTITFIDYVDFGLRILSGVIAIVVGVVAFKNYQLKNELLRKEIELKDQELFEAIKRNKEL